LKYLFHCGESFAAGRLGLLRADVQGMFAWFIVLLASFSDDAVSTQQAAWNVIDASLADGSSEHRREALAAIGTIAAPDPEAVRRVEGALQDKDSTVRQTAALVLGELKATDSIPKLKESLDDKGEVAFAAAKALAALGDPTGRDFLIEVLAGERKDTAPGIVANAKRKAEDELHHPRQMIFMGAEDATGAMFGPVSVVLPAVKDSVDLKRKGAPGRAAAAAYLSKDPEPYAIPLLEWGLDDENQFVRIEAAKGLGQRGNSGSIPKLQPLLAESHNYVRDMAAAAVIRIESREGLAGAPAEGLPQVTTKKH
jgi:HEAT repeat protein